MNNGQVAGKSPQLEHLEEGKTYFGSPAGDAREKMKEVFIVKRVQEILDRLDKLENK